MARPYGSVCPQCGGKVRRPDVDLWYCLDCGAGK